MSNVEKLLRSRDYSTIRAESSPSGDNHWLYMHDNIGSGMRP